MQQNMNSDKGGGVSHFLIFADKGGRGVGQFLILAHKGGRGGLVYKPPFLADIICEQPLIDPEQYI